MKAYYEVNKAMVDSIHQSESLAFTAVPINWVRDADESYRLHHSARWNGRQGSEYRLVVMRYGPFAGEIAYARISNHWGTFHTSPVHDTPCVLKSGLCSNHTYTRHDWQLDGGQRRKDGEYANVSQAGILPLRALELAWKRQ